MVACACGPLVYVCVCGPLVCVCVCVCVVHLCVTVVEYTIQSQVKRSSYLLALSRARMVRQSFYLAETVTGHSSKIALSTNPICPYRPTLSRKWVNMGRKGAKMGSARRRSEPVPTSDPGTRSS
jgi:hypothetical protein